MLLKSIFSRSFIKESWFLGEKPRDSTSAAKIFLFRLTGFKAAFCFYAMPKVMLCAIKLLPGGLSSVPLDAKRIGYIIPSFLVSGKSAPPKIFPAGEVSLFYIAFVL